MSAPRPELPISVPLYLSGSIRPGLPAMITPRMRQRPLAGHLWAADTGCFSAAGEYHVAKHIAWLHELGADDHGERCLFATTPDVFGDGDATLRLFAATSPWLAEVASRIALVVQPWVAPRQIPWDSLDAVFIGGPNEWQHSDACHAVAREAKRRGKWLHVGRVNTKSRLRIAAGYGADSVDGTFLAFGYDANLPRLVRWFDELHTEVEQRREALAASA